MTEIMFSLKTRPTSKTCFNWNSIGCFRLVIFSKFPISVGISFKPLRSIDMRNYSLIKRICCSLNLDIPNWLIYQFLRELLVKNLYQSSYFKISQEKQHQFSFDSKRLFKYLRRAISEGITESFISAKNMRTCLKRICNKVSNLFWNG